MALQDGPHVGPHVATPASTVTRRLRCCAASCEAGRSDSIPCELERRSQCLTRTKSLNARPEIAGLANRHHNLILPTFGISRSRSNIRESKRSRSPRVHSDHEWLGLYSPGPKESRNSLELKGEAAGTAWESVGSADASGSAGGAGGSSGAPPRSAGGGAGGSSGATSRASCSAAGGSRGCTRETRGGATDAAVVAAGRAGSGSCGGSRGEPSGGRTRDGLSRCSSGGTERGSSGAARGVSGGGPRGDGGGGSDSGARGGACKSAGASDAAGSAAPCAAAAGCERCRAAGTETGSPDVSVG